MSAGVWALPASPFRFTLSVARIPLRGEGSLRVLHGQTTQAIEGAAPGSLIETCCVTPTATALGSTKANNLGASSWAPRPLRVTGLQLT